MPYIEIKTTKTVTDEKCEKIKSEMGRAIECFKGKSEAWLMVTIDDEKKMWFRGDGSEDSAFVAVDLLGKVDKNDSEKMTEAVCDILEKELQISPERVYVKYSGYESWGWNKGNF